MQERAIEQVKKIYDIDNSSTLELLGGFDNNVYLCRDKNIVIKFLDKVTHKKEYLLNELEVINLMMTHGIHTPAPIPSKNGMVIELIKGMKKDFYLVAFSYVKGKILLDYEEDNQLIKQWGKTLGKMHNISKNFAFKLDNFFVDWNYDINFEKFSKGKGQLIEKKWRTYMKKLSSMSCNQDMYGIVHHDLHNQNIIISDNKMYVLDFGDVRKSWYAYDASIPVFHALEKNRKNKTDNIKFYERFTKYFFEGYCETSNFSIDQFKLIPFFLEYRLLYSYLFFINSFPSNKMSSDMKNSLDRMRYRIENNVPFIT
ncbi:phosphotransferase [Pseudogracilibacillus sp. SE30717A]|uniref:phosphotransferase enzyme family protein n=1 Tax=Pseudogracilibacillus sp. SE30717A TaxID=3098293 RepID=UPI00300E242F